jgi:hypothetical protein
LQDEKAAILDEVMDKETYKVATKILERFDPARLQGGAARPQAASGGGPVLRQPGPPLLRGGGGGGQELRRRAAAAAAGPTASPQQQQLNSSLSLPATAALNTLQVDTKTVGRGAIAGGN